jgi:hypothetical protein
MLRDWESVGYASPVVPLVRIKRAREEHLLAFEVRILLLVETR